MNIPINLNRYFFVVVILLFSFVMLACSSDDDPAPQAQTLPLPRTMLLRLPLRMEDLQRWPRHFRLRALTMIYRETDRLLYLRRPTMHLINYHRER